MLILVLRYRYVQAPRNSDKSGINNIDSKRTFAK